MSLTTGGSLIRNQPCPHRRPRTAEGDGRCEASPLGHPGGGRLTQPGGPPDRSRVRRRTGANDRLPTLDEVLAFPVDRVVVHPVRVGEIFPLPRLGDVFADVRDNGRTMRISCHKDRGAVVVSMWRDTLCRGSFRLAADDMDRFISTLTEMSTSLRSTATTADQAEVSTPHGPDRDAAAADFGKVSDPVEPPFEQTGDVTGTANFGRPVSVPVLRVA